MAAAALLAVALVTPFLIELMTVVFFAAAEAVVPVTFRAVDAVVPAAGRPTLRTTVDVLASLDSLIPLTLRAFRAAAAAADLEAGAAPVPDAAPRPRVRAAVAVAPPAAELAVEDVVGFRVVAARVARAFSTMELMRFDAEACFVGDMGRAIKDLAGDEGGAAAEAGAAPRSRSRGFMRELDEAGDRTCPGCVPWDVPGAPRWRFFGLSRCAFWFSLSPLANWSLGRWLASEI